MKVVYVDFVKGQFAKAKSGAELKAAIMDRYPSYMAAIVSGYSKSVLVSRIRQTPETDFLEIL